MSRWSTAEEHRIWVRGRVFCLHVIRNPTQERIFFQCRTSTSARIMKLCGRQTHDCIRVIPVFAEWDYIFNSNNSSCFFIVYLYTGQLYCFKSSRSNEIWKVHIGAVGLWSKQSICWHRQPEWGVTAVFLAAEPVKKPTSEKCWDVAQRWISSPPCWRRHVWFLFPLCGSIRDGSRNKRVQFWWVISCICVTQILSLLSSCWRPVVGLIPFILMSQMNMITDWGLFFVL